MPPPAPSLSPARGSRTSPCSPFCPVYTTLFTDSRLHPAPSPTCGGGGVQGGQETELSAVSGTWPQRAPQSLNENGTNLNTLLVGWSPPPPYTHTFCPGSPLRSLFTAGRHQVPSAPQAMRGGGGGQHTSTPAGVGCRGGGQCARVKVAGKV